MLSVATSSASSSNLQLLQSGRRCTRNLQLDLLTVFRYSAVTVNSHKIHYAAPYTQSVERHPELIVQCPLSLTLLLDLWRDIVTKRAVIDRTTRLTPQEVKYRALAPLYVSGVLERKLPQLEGGDAQLWIEKADDTRMMLVTVRVYTTQNKL